MKKKKHAGVGLMAGGNNFEIDGEGFTFVG